MTGEDKVRKKKRRLLGIAFSFVSIATLIYITITLISGRTSGLTKLTGLFSARTPAGMADEYHFDVGRGRVFADLGSHLAAAGTLGVQVLDESGTETLRDPFLMSSPALSVTDEYAIAFDIGGAAVRVFDDSRILSSIEASGAVVSATINRNGWFCLCTQESGAFKSFVTVYDNKGREVYKISLASGYALSSLLSSDNRRLAVLCLTDEGSRVTLYDINNESYDSEYIYPNGLIIDISYLPNGELLAVAADSLILIDKDGADSEFYGFSGRRLGGYSIGSSFITLHLLDYNVSHHGRLITLSDGGKLLGELETDREIISISSDSRYLAILQSDGLVLFDEELSELPPIEGLAATVGATQVVALGNGAALAAGEHSAVVYRATQNP